MEQVQKPYAIVVLTRGYTSIKDYSNLLRRNKSIYDKIYNKDKFNKYKFDVIIFHEGNITKEHQEIIQNFIPEMPLEFKQLTFQKNVATPFIRLCPPTRLSESFSIGYKNMCYFWAVDFINHLKDYEYIIRVDEDCVLTKIHPNILDIYKQQNLVFGSPYFQGPDNPQVTIGLDKFFIAFLNSVNKTTTNLPTEFPYTNVMIVNTGYFAKSPVIKKIHEKLTECNCIFSNRWGDLAIWGYILSIFIHPTKYIEDKNISYYHESHNKIVN